MVDLYKLTPPTTPAALARQAQVTLNLIYRMVWSGQLEAERTPSGWKIAPESAARYLERRRQRHERQGRRRQCKS